MDTGMLLSHIILVPISIFIGFGASAIGFTAWPLIIPILFVLFGYNLYLAIFTSLAIDCGNALIMTAFSIKKRNVNLSESLIFVILALSCIVPAMYIGKQFIYLHENSFRGSTGFFIIFIGLLFICKGFKQIVSEENSLSDDKSNKYPIKNILIYPGVILMASMTGLIGVGGGMGYAALLILLLSYKTHNATGTAMLITLCTTFIAALFIFFEIPAQNLPDLQSTLTITQLILLSMLGTIVGAKVSYSIPEKQIFFFIGSLVIFAGVISAMQKFIIGGFFV